MRKSMLLEAPLSEYEQRISKLCAELKKRGMDGILLSAPDNMRYFCGHRSIVWDSNVSMPGTLVVSADGTMRLAGSQSNHPTAVRTACVDEDCYIAYFNGGVRKPGQPTSYPEAICQAFTELGLENGKIGMEWGRGCRVRMIHADYEQIISTMLHANFVDASDVIWAVRGVKSPYEQDLLRKVNNINTKLFEHAYERLIPGVTTERELYNSMVSEAFALGCDSMLELDVRGHKDRYGLPNCPPSNMPFGTEDGTAILIDGGPSYQGYFSDIIRIGVGHSLGLNVHEYPCLEAGEETPLKAGMVMTLEPNLDSKTAGSMVLEQNFIITEDGYELLSKMPTEMVRIH